jgi:hypothetical protein
MEVSRKTALLCRLLQAKRPDKKDPYPIPLINKMIDCLKHAKISSKLDIRQASTDLYRLPNLRIPQFNTCYSSVLTNVTIPEKKEGTLWQKGTRV